MTVTINNKRFGQDDFMILLRTLTRNHEKSWFSSDKIKLTKDDHEFMTKLVKAHSDLLVRLKRLSVWEQLQRQVISNMTEESRHYASDKSDLYDGFHANCKVLIRDFLRCCLNNPVMYNRETKYMGDGDWGSKNTFCGKKSLVYKTLFDLGMVSHLKQSYNSFEQSIDFEAELRADLEEQDCWSYIGTAETYRKKYIKNKRDHFSKKYLHAWLHPSSNGILYYDLTLSSDTVGAIRRYSDLTFNTFSKTLFYELHAYIENRQHAVSSMGSNHYRFRFWGVSAVVKLRAAEKLKNACDSRGNFKSAGQLILTSDEAVAVTTGELGRLCAKHLASHLDIYSLFEQLAASSLSGEANIDLTNCIARVVDPEDLVMAPAAIPVAIAEECVTDIPIIDALGVCLQ